MKIKSLIIMDFPTIFKKRFISPMTDLTTQHIGLVFKARRLTLNYSQDYIGYKLGISQNSYSKIELGYVQLTLDRFLCICRILDINITDLLLTIPVNDLQNNNSID